jgi:hypothetical protein
MGLRPTQVDEKASVASAPEGRHENSPGPKPWVDRRREVLSPGGATEMSPKILKEIGSVFDHAAKPTRSMGFSHCVSTCSLKKLSRFSEGAAAFRLLKYRKIARRL